MSLHIHHAARLAALVEPLAAMLASPLPDPFAAEVVGVPTVGVRDWLQQQLALRLGAGVHQDGISANIDMVFPNRFTAAALGHRLHESSPWDLDRLTWTVLQALHAGVVDVPGWSARRSRPGVAATGAYTTARQIADLFDRYANNRPQLLQQWRAGRTGDGTLDDHGAVVPLPADQVWQAQLWRAVREAIGVPTNAEMLPDLLADLGAGRLEPELPERVAVFGVSSVSAAQLAVMQALAHVREVHLHLVHPSPLAWKRCRQQLAGRLALRSATDATAAVEHSLLRSWGRPPMETAALVGGLDAAQHAADPPIRPPVTLLARVQADLVADRPPDSDHPTGDHEGKSITSSAQARHDDRTIQVHACHGATRQLEVLRDALGHLFADDPTLAAHDVLILCPDLARFAPLIQSVFQRSSFPVPVRVSDLSLGTGNPVAGALSALLTTIAGRCTGADVLQLITLEPVHRMFEFGDDDAERINEWIADLGTTWGLDSTHRSEWVPAHIVEGTWSATLDRLLLGAAMPAPVSRVGPGGTVPFDDVDTSGLAIAGRLAELIVRLQRARKACAGQRSIGDWVSVLHELVGRFFATHPDDAWQVAELVEAISAIGDQAGHNDVPLSLADARAVLAAVLADDRGRLVLRSGAVTATALEPVRNVPARVVCILGLDDASLRSTSPDGDDILGLRPCVGERDQRVDGRHLLLDALMSAGEHFVITCDGSDITTNRPLPIPVYLAELLDIVQASSADAGGVTVPGSWMIIRHPRRAYDERNFIAGNLNDYSGDGPVGFVAGRPFTFDTAMLAGATARRTAAPVSEPWPLLKPVVPATVTLAVLAESCTRPERTFLHRRLDARLPAEADQLDVSIPLRFVGLDQYQLGNELLDLHRRGADGSVIGAWREAHRHSGALPPRALADAVLDDTEREVKIVLDSSADLRSLLVAARGSCEVELSLTAPDSDGAVVGIRETIQRLDVHRLIRVAFTRPGPRPTISAAIDLAALVAVQPDQPWEALVVTRPKSGSYKGTAAVLRPVNGPSRREAALAFLETALSFHLRALREPIPFFERSSRTLYDLRTIDDEEFARDIRGDAAQFLWGANTADDILSIPLRTDDELAAVASAGAGRAQAFADHFWRSFDAFIPPPADTDQGADQTTDVNSGAADAVDVDTGAGAAS